MDDVVLRFSPAGLAVLQAALALVMFGVALDLTPRDFRRVWRAGRPVLVGIAGQLLLLPAATFALVWCLEPPPSLAFGMLLVAACPGGNISNFMSHLAGGNVALSVSLSAVSTVSSIVTTPLNLAFWAGRYSPTAALLQQVAVDPLELAITVAVLLGLPILLGMAFAHFRPLLAARLRRPMRGLSLVVLGLFVVAALVANFDFFQLYAARVFALVAIHNGLALALGYFLARLAGLQEAERRTLAIEVGIQNSGLGLILLFQFFNALGGAAILAAFWGIWHILSGLALSSWWGRRVCSEPVARV